MTDISPESSTQEPFSPTEAVRKESQERRKSIATGVLLATAGVLLADVTFPATINAVKDLVGQDGLKVMIDTVVAGTSGLLSHGFIQSVRGKAPYNNLFDRMVNPNPPQSGQNQQSNT